MPYTTSRSARNFVCTTLVIACALIGIAPADGFASLPPGMVAPELASVELPVVVTDTVDHAALIAEDLGKASSAAAAGPTRFAVGLDAEIRPGTNGVWHELDNGWRLWRVEIHSAGALSLNLHLDRFDLAPGAELWLHDPDGAHLQGPFTAADRDRLGGLWTPVVVGDRMVVELVTPPEALGTSTILVSQVNHGYRFFGETKDTTKQGSCNIDVVCPEGNAWRDQIRSVARYSIGGVGLCTGTLVNNTAQDHRPLFLTADHCEVREANDNSIVVYWNYEAPSCGMLSGGSLSQNQRGSTFLSTWDWDSGSDFTLVELDEVPDAEFNVYYAGWDVSGSTPQSVVGIHHPSADEKAISFENDPLTTRWNSHWVINAWDMGTTEQGSSGSCIFDQSNGLCVGTLSGGYASCGDPEGDDWYGMLNKSWTGNGTPSGRLSDYLDPLGTGATTLDGIDSSGGSGGGTQWLIPAAASATGFGGSDWKTQIGIANPTSAAVTAIFHYVEQGAQWPGEQLPGTFTAPANGAFFVDDVLLARRPTSGLMVVEVDSDEAVVSTRTYNQAAGSATFGQGIPGIRLDTASSTTKLMLPLILSAPNQFHTNLGLVQTSAGTSSAQVIVHAPSGAQLGVKTYTMNAAFKQVNDLLQDMGIGNQVLEGGWIEIRLTAGSPAYWMSYASVVDDQTSDPTYVGPTWR